MNNNNSVTVSEKFQDLCVTVVIGIAAFVLDSVRGVRRFWFYLAFVALVAASALCFDSLSVRVGCYAAIFMALILVELCQTGSTSRNLRRFTERLFI